MFGFVIQVGGTISSPKITALFWLLGMLGLEQKKSFRHKMREIQLKIVTL